MSKSQVVKFTGRSFDTMNDFMEARVKFHQDIIDTGKLTVRWEEAEVMVAGKSVLAVVEVEVQ